MATGRDLQRLFAKDVLLQKPNRKERRAQERSFRLAKPEQKYKRRRKVLILAAAEFALGTILGLGLFWMLFLADDGSSRRYAVPKPEQRWYVDSRGSDYYYTSEEDFLGYLQDKTAWEAEEAAFWDAVRESQTPGRNDHGNY